MKKHKILCLLLVIQGTAALSAYAEEVSDEEAVRALTKSSENVTLPGDAVALLDVAKLAVVNSPSIKQQTLGLDMSKAAEQIAGGMFDFNTYLVVGYQNSRAATDHPPYTPEVVRMDTDAQYSSAGVVKSFRSGISADLSATMTHADIRSFPVHSNNTTAVAFKLKVPLLRGSGYTSAAADEVSARLTREAASLDIQQFVASILLDSVKNYWEYKLAVETLRAYERSEKRVSEWVSNSGASQLSANDPAIESLEGYLSDKKRKVAVARDAMNTARSNLASSLGIAADKVNNLGEPVSNFPMNWDEVLEHFDQEASNAQWLNTALEKRLDLQAARLRQQASAALVAKAERDLLPQLDLDLATGYNGYEGGDGMDKYVDSFYGHVDGINSSASLTLSVPIGNNIAKGVLDLNRAKDQQSKIAVDELTRQTGLEIGDFASNIKGLLVSTVEASKTINSYYNSLEQLTNDKTFLREPVKFLTALDMEDKLVTALLEKYNAMKELANTIATVRFKTGTLIVPSETLYEVKLDDLTSLPLLN